MGVPTELAHGSVRFSLSRLSTEAEVREAARIVAAAKQAAEEEAALAAQRAKDALREQVAQLAVVGAERILRREIDAARHADLLANLKNELR